MPKIYTKNPRKVTNDAIEKLRKSLIEIGDISRIVHDIKRDEIVGGHQRLKSMFGVNDDGEFDLSNAEIVITEQYNPPTPQGTIAVGYIRWNGDNFFYRQVIWDDDKFKKANIVANMSVGQWDWEIITQEFVKNDFEKLGIDIELWLDAVGSDYKNLSLFYNTPIINIDNNSDALDSDNDDITNDSSNDDELYDKLLQVWKPERGGIWQIGNHRLMCGDSLCDDDVKKLLGENKIKLFSTDPPYLVDYTGANRPSSFKDWSDKYIDINYKKSELYSKLFSVWCEYFYEGTAVFVWHGFEYQKNLYDAMQAYNIHPAQLIIWVKPAARIGYLVYPYRHESCIFGWYKRKPYVLPGLLKTLKYNSVWELDYDGKNNIIGNLHPTQKPIEIFARPIRIHTRKNDICVEPFSGSGSQLVAGQLEGRIVYAMEIQPVFVAVALQRMRDAFPELDIKRVE